MIDFLFLILENIFFQLAVIIVFGALIASNSVGFDDNGHGGTIAHKTNFIASLILVAAALYHFDINISTLKANWIIALGGVVAYYLIGVVWSFIKWVWLLKNIKSKFDSALELVSKRYNIPAVDLMTAGAYQADQDQAQRKTNALNSLIAALNDLGLHTSYQNDASLLAQPSNIYNHIQPKLTNNKVRGIITDWILAWPYSIMVFLLKDLVSVLGRFFFVKFKGLYVKIQQSIFKPIQ